MYGSSILAGVSTIHRKDGKYDPNAVLAFQRGWDGALEDKHRKEQRWHDTLTRSLANVNWVHPFAYSPNDDPWTGYYHEN